MDRISELPESILQLILTRMPIGDAVGTSILSSKWRYIWTGIPKLVFDRDFKPKSFGENDVASTIYEILLQHHGPIAELKLEMPRLPRQSHPQIDHVINFTLKNGLEHLKLIVPHGSARYKVPSSLFSGNSLKQLNLYNCEFQIPQKLIELSRLTSLECDDIVVDSNEFNRFIAACPMLRVLSLKIGHGIKLEITSALQLEYLYLESAESSLSLENVPLLSTLRIPTLKIHAFDEMTKMIDFFTQATLEDLELGYHALRAFAFYFLFKSLAAGDLPKELPHDLVLVHLRSLKFVDITLSILVEVSAILGLIRSAPNLHYIDIKICACDSQDLDSALKMLAAQESSDVILDKLVRVQMHCVGDTQPEMEFIRLLFAKSPVLQKMVIQTAIKSSEGRHTLLKKLARFPRASVRAELVFIDP